MHRLAVTPPTRHLAATPSPAPSPAPSTNPSTHPSTNPAPDTVRSPSGAVLAAIRLSEEAHGVRGLDVLRRSVDRAPPRRA